MTECGVMNFFYVKKNTDGSLEVLTCKLNGTILPGVTRQSVIDLCKEWGVKVTEREISLAEFIELHKQGQVVEAFCSGTAANIVPVKSITHDDVKYSLLPEDKENGDLSIKLYNTLTDIQYGNVQHEFQRRII